MCLSATRHKQHRNRVCVHAQPLRFHALGSSVRLTSEAFLLPSRRRRSLLPGFAPTDAFESFEGVTATDQETESEWETWISALGLVVAAACGRWRVCSLGGISTVPVSRVLLSLFRLPPFSCVWCDQ